MVINDFVAAMQAKDHRALAACFAEECRLVDYCPSQVKRPNAFLYGRNAIEMFYHNKFMFGGFTMHDGGADKKLDTPVSGLESACTRWRPGSSPWRPSRRGSA